MKKLFFILFTALIPLCPSAQENGTLNFAEPIVVDDNYVKQQTSRSIGIYITDIYDLNPADGRFSIEFRTWSYGSKEARTSYIEFPHAQKTNFSGLQLIQYHDSIWRHFHVSSVYHYDWDMSYFPFDKQTLRIECENSLDRSFVELKGDIKNSGIDPEAIQSGFKISDVRFFDDVRQTTTNFGNPIMDENEECEFSTFVTEIDIRRDDPWTLFMKVFSAVIVSFFIATISFVINPRHFDARLSLIVGSLFAAVGSKFVVDSFVGVTTELTLMDQIYILTYILIFTIAILLLISHRVYQNIDNRGANHILYRHFDLLAFGGTNIIYVSSIALMIGGA